MISSIFKLNASSLSNDDQVFIAAAICLMLAFNVSIMIRWDFFSVLPSEVITAYFVLFIVVIGLILYFSIRSMRDVTREYVEGCILGISSMVIIMLFLPLLLLEYIVLITTDPLWMLAIIYIGGILTVIGMSWVALLITTGYSDEVTIIVPFGRSDE